MVMKMTTNKEARFLEPTTKIMYPSSAEREYYRLLRAVLRKLKELTLAEMEEIKGALRQDSTESEKIIEEILADFIKSGVKTDVMEGVRRIMNSVDKTAKENLRQAFRNCLQVDVFIDDTELLNKVTEEWYSSQSKLVNSIVSTYTDKLGIVVSNAVQRGSLYKDVKEEIKGIYDVTDNRAKFIARNEIGNLNAITTKTRQEEAGIYCYEWQTSQDERVRDSHAAMDGDIYYWSGNKVGEINGLKVYPAPKFHPGMDYNCRCVAIPIIDTEAWDKGNVVPLGLPDPKESKELLLLKSGKVGDTDGYSVIDYVGNIEYNDSKKIEEYFSYFAKNMVDEKVEKALIVTASNRLYQLTGTSGTVNITLVGEAALKGAKIIHNHPASYGVLGDAFSREDFVGLFTYGITTLEVASGLGRFRLRYKGKPLSAGEASELYNKACNYVVNQSIMHKRGIEYLQLETMEQIKKLLPGVIFERI